VELDQKLLHLIDGHDLGRHRWEGNSPKKQQYRAFPHPDLILPTEA
jgi:hypothetical protein